MASESRLAEPRYYGYTCWNCKEVSPETAVTSDREAWAAARTAGWGLGLDATGQAHYSCDGCSPSLFNFQVLGAYI